MNPKATQHLRDGWTTVELREVGRIVTGSTPPKAKTEYYGGSFPFVKPPELRHGPVNDAEDKLSDKGADVADVAPVGSVLVSCIGNLGKTGRATQPVAFNQQINAIIPHEPNASKWIFYAVQTSDFASQLAKVSSATTIAIVNKGKFSGLRIPFAPEDEQREIVAEIEKQFTRLEAGVAGLRRVQANLKRYRAAVLKVACEGNLVPTEAELARQEGRTYETGAQLLERILTERRKAHECTQSAGSRKKKYTEPAPPNVVTDQELPEGWTWATWDQIGLSQNGRPFPSAQYEAKGFKLLRPGNLHISGEVVWTEDNTRYMPQHFADENHDLIVQGRELVMNLTAQSLKDQFLGRVCLTHDGEECLLNQRLARLTPVVVAPEFALYLLKAWRFRRFVDGLNSGSLIQHMFTSQLAEFTFPLPPLAEQQRIVAEVERCLSVVEELEAVVNANLQRASRLRQSILQKAFSGNLSTS